MALVSVPYVVQHTASRSRIVRERHAVSVSVDTVEGFEEEGVVVTAEGTEVGVGRIGERMFVRAPWEADVPSQGHTRGYGDEDVGMFMEPDPTSRTTRQGRVFRADDPTVTFTDTPGTDAPYDRKLAQDRAERAAAHVTWWVEGGVRVGGALYVPTHGISVHVASTPTMGTMPAVEFGWSGMRRTDSLVEGWRPGWEPYGGWDVGALHVPDGFLLDRVGLELAGCVRAVTSDPTWGSRLGDLRDGVVGPHARLRRAHDQGDPAVFAAALVKEQRRRAGWGRGRLVMHLARAVEAMDPPMRERFEAYVADGPAPPAPAELEGLRFGG